MNHLERSCEEIDASVFSSDLLWNDERRAMLKVYVDRWHRAIAEQEADDDNGPEPLTGGDERRHVICLCPDCATPPAAPVQEPVGSFQHRCVECKGVFSASRAPRSGRCLRCAAPVQEPVGRTDQQIVDQTEELAVWLLSWGFNRQPETAAPMRESAHPMAQRCWAAACHIQEMLTATDPENAVAELDDQAYANDHEATYGEAQREPLTDDLSIWVLTSQYNDYDQHGEYFEAVYVGKPTAEQIQKHCQVIDASHILSGGGRVKFEYHWYNLRQEAAHGIKGGA